MTVTRAQIEALYQENLQRPGDDGGIEYYVDQGARGVTLAEIDRMMESSPEYLVKRGNATGTAPIAATAARWLPLLLIGGVVLFVVMRKRKKG